MDDFYSLFIKKSSICRTWSVPSHIPLPPLYPRGVALTGAQHWEGSGPQPKGQPLSAPLDWKILWPWSDWHFIMIRKVAQTFYSGLSMALRESYQFGEPLFWLMLYIGLDFIGINCQEVIWFQTSYIRYSPWLFLTLETNQIWTVVLVLLLYVTHRIHSPYQSLVYATCKPRNDPPLLSSFYLCWYRMTDVADGMVLCTDSSMIKKKTRKTNYQLKIILLRQYLASSKSGLK